MEKKNSKKGMYDILMEKVVDSMSKSKKENSYYKNYEMASNIMNNYFACWNKTSDSLFRNNNYNYLSDKDEYPDPVALKLSNLEKIYNRNFKNNLKKSDKRKKDMKFIRKYVGFGKLEMRDRLMKKEKYNYILETSEKDIVKRIINGN